MLKKIFKVATTFGILLGCYFGYVRAFDLVVLQFQSERFDNSMLLVARTARSKQEAQDLARLTFGDDHWTVTTDLPYAYYNSQKRFWMYWQEYEEIKEEDGVRYDGKRVRMHPFAMIGRSGDGKNIWRLTADSATLDLNQPIGISNKQSSEGIKVEHALVEGNVRIRDDRGTPAILVDDMNIGPMTYVDYDEARRLITTESHVRIQDPDQTTDGDGLEILLRKIDPALASSQSSSSTGFGGAERAILHKNVRVVMRDVGNSGVLPGAGPPPRKPATPPKTVDLTVNATAKDGAAKGDKPPEGDQPVPLFVQSDGPMQVDFPPEPVPVLVGPPAPPAPTLVRFERKVVALHGDRDDEPNQLDCDTLRLTLIPGTPPPPAGKGKGRAGGKKAEKQGTNVATASPASGASAPPTAVAPLESSSAAPAVMSAESKAGPDGGQVAATEGSAGPSSKGGLFGNLTLQKAHATGHVVWLQLRKQSAKVRCSEMIHERCMPYRPDYTFFRGDRSRMVWLEKTDYETEEEAPPAAVAQATSPTPDGSSNPKPRKIKSVTHVLTVSATLFDRGNTLDLADIRAIGPGRLESRPALTEPVERIAVWQDELTIVNLIKPDGTLQQKRVTLTGNRPFFVDLPKKTSLDSAKEIRVFLKPQSAPQAGATPVAATPSQPGTEDLPATHVAARPPATSPPAGDAFATGADLPAASVSGGGSTGGSATGVAAGGAGANANSGLGGNLQVERILAYRDVHFKAPNRYMEARKELDAPFIEVDPAPPAQEPTAEAGADGTTPATSGTTAPGSGVGAPASSGQPAPEPDGAKAPATGAGDASKNAAPEPAEPAMTAVADRIWARVAIPRGQSLDPEKDKRKKKPSTSPVEAGRETVAAGEPWADAAPSPTPQPKQGEAEIREARLCGNVAVHEDKPPDPAKKGQAKPKGNDIHGEAVYLDNKGPGKLDARVYAQDPTDPTPLPGPIAWAMVSTDDMTVFGKTLYMDQEKDKVWAFGPGSLSQWTDRTMMTDKAPESQPAAANSGAAPAVAMAEGPPDPDIKPAAPPKPKTRGGKPVPDRDLLTITWTEQMEFTGRTKDTSGRPAGRADFLGVVNAEMTDAKLHCEKWMVVYTDREVPLGDLGPSKKGSAGATEREAREGDEDAEGAASGRSRVDVAKIYCYGKPTAISRKIDPDYPEVIEQQRIDAWDYYRDPSNPDPKSIVPGRLDYDRRTGAFFVPGPGMVFLYDRPDEGQQKGGIETKPGETARTAAAPVRAGTATRGGTRTGGARTLTPTSARTSDRGVNTPAKVSRGPAAAGGQQGAPPAPATPPISRTFKPLVLMQVKFRDGMKGRMGAGQANDTTQPRWSEFFGNIEFLRSQVKYAGEMLDPDQRLSPDGFYLTSQTLRIIQEPPPPGSPAKTPAHSFAKAFDRVHVNRGEAFTIESDVVTFDSASDLLWAYGEGGHGVSFAQQSGPGQPPSTSQARAVQYNVKSHAWREVDGSNIIFVDQRTGGRPGRASTPDPTAPPRPKVKVPYKVPNTNLERRGFTGF